jgi:hypothetical protein
MIDTAASTALATESLSAESEAILTGWIETHDEPTVIDGFEIDENVAPVISGFEVDTDEDTDTDTDTDTVAPNTHEAADLRAQREALHVSRTTVAKATGLSPSVVWRSEQSEGVKRIENADWTKLELLYVKWATNGVPAEYAKPVKAPKTPKTNHADTQRYEDLVNSLWSGLTLAIETRKERKAGTKDLVALVEKIDEFRTS